VDNTIKILPAAEGDEYEFQESSETAIPEVPEGVGAAVISSGSSDTSKTSKKALKAKFKPRQLPKVRGCGHRIDLARQPRHRNCESCWTAFFHNQPGMSENLAKNIHDQGVEPIVHVHGEKFLKRFVKYAILLAQVENLKKDYREDPNGGKVQGTNNF
jgi:hypothetical protein